MAVLACHQVIFFVQSDLKKNVIRAFCNNKINIEYKTIKENCTNAVEIKCRINIQIATKKKKKICVCYIAKTDIEKPNNYFNF